MRLGLCALLGLIGVISGGPAMVAGPDQEMMQVELAVARFAQAGFVGRKLGFDEVPQEFATPHDPTGPPRAPYRTPEHSVRLAKLSGGRLLATATGALCSVWPGQNCVEAILRIGVPQVTGDSAMVWMYVYEEIPGGTEETDTRLLLVKQTGEWRVVKTLDTRRAYSGGP